MAKRDVRGFQALIAVMVVFLCLHFLAQVIWYANCIFSAGVMFFLISLVDIRYGKFETGVLIMGIILMMAGVYFMLHSFSSVAAAFTVSLLIFFLFREYCSPKKNETAV